MSKQKLPTEEETNKNFKEFLDRMWKDLMFGTYNKKPKPKPKKSRVL